MRGRTVRIVGIAAAFASVIGFLHADPEREARIADLVKQLGSAEFTRRESAARELEAIGEPALPALRKAANDKDPEVRRRAERVLQVLNDRFKAAITKQEIAKWQGEWFGELQQSMTIRDDKWTSKTPTFGPISGVLRIVEVRADKTLVDMVVEEGPTKGNTCRAIFKIEGRSLHYCGTYGARPTEFLPSPENTYIEWKKEKPAPPPPPPPVIVEETFESIVLPIPLVLPECLAGARRVSVRAKLTDGGKTTVRFDPLKVKLDAFGDEQAAAQPAPAVAFEGTLRLIKTDKDRTLYEIRATKLASRLSLVAFKDVTPWGDGRLLVHDKDGTVRHALELHIHRQQFPPCHPGCFPAGTAVRVPGGVKAIESIREGDMVTTVRADGSAGSAKVIGVFSTRNRVLEVRIDGGKLVTTETQPIAVDGGDPRAASELKPGDRVWRWIDGKQKTVTVREVTAAVPEAMVFNLVLGEPTVFIAGDFLVRSKPPPEARP